MSYDREVGACWFIMSNERRVDLHSKVVRAGLVRD